MGLLYIAHIVKRKSTVTSIEDKPYLAKLKEGQELHVPNNFIVSKAAFRIWDLEFFCVTVGMTVVPTNLILIFKAGQYPLESGLLFLNLL